MTSTESAYVGGIIDGEGHVEFKWVNRIRRDRKGTPTYRTLIVRLEVPQVDKRLIDYLMEVTKEGTRDIKRYPKNPTYHDQHRWLSWRLPSTQTGLPVFNCEKGKSTTTDCSL